MDLCWQSNVCFLLDVPEVMSGKLVQSLSEPGPLLMACPRPGQCWSFAEWLTWTLLLVFTIEVGQSPFRNTEVNRSEQE